MAKLLLVEDDPRIAGFIERGLGAEGHVVDIAATGTDALRMARRGGYALMILDRMLPDFDGVEVCRQLRLERVGTRILMLTAKDALGDKVGGLRAGADDYLTKPFSFDEFVARIEALLRRSDLHRHEPELRVADLALDPTTRRVTRGGRAIELTPKEYELLRYLMENAGTVLSRSQILNNTGATASIRAPRWWTSTSATCARSSTRARPRRSSTPFAARGTASASATDVRCSSAAASER